MLERTWEELPRFLTIFNAEFLLEAMFATFVLTAVGCGAGLILGLGIAVLRRTVEGWLAPFRYAAILFVELFRRIPFLVTLFIVFYAFELAGFDIPVFLVAVIGVGLIGTAYISEIVRAGFDSVHRNQWDSAAVANFGLVRTLRYIVIPQAWKVILPPAFSFFLVFIKDSSLASQIGVVELTFAGKMFNDKGFTPALAWGSILMLYFILSYPLALLGRHLEMRLARPSHR